MNDDRQPQATDRRTAPVPVADLFEAEMRAGVRLMARRVTTAPEMEERLMQEAGPDGDAKALDAARERLGMHRPGDAFTFDWTESPPPTRRRRN